MGRLHRWLDERKRWQRAKREQMALRKASQSRLWRPTAETGEWDKLSDAISDEVARRMAVGELTTLRAIDVLLEAITKAYRTQLSPYSPDWLFPLLTPAAIRQFVTEVMDDREQRTERRQAQKQKLELSLQAAKEDVVRRARATKAAPGLLAGAGISAGPDELKIAIMLLMHHENATPEQLQQAVKTFEDAYERRVQRYKDTGGQTPWPTADPLIQLLFGRH